MGGAALRREQNRVKMRQAILDEAGRLLSEQGLAAVSMRAIARELKYSPAALYEYFSGIDEVLNSLYFDGVGGLDGRMRNALSETSAAESALQKVRSLGYAYRTYAHSQLELFRLQFSENKVNTFTHEVDGSRPGYGLLVLVLEEGKATGEIIDRPTSLLGLFCWSTVHGFVTLETSAHIVTGANDEVFEEVLDLVERGISAASFDVVKSTER